MTGKMGDWYLKAGDLFRTVTKMVKPANRGFVMNMILTLKEMIHYWYWEEFSYADNRFCMFLEKFFSPKVVRWFAFHCYCLTMILIFATLTAMLFSYAGKLFDIILNRGIVE